MKRALSILFFVCILCCIFAWSDTTNFKQRASSIPVPQEVFLQPGDTNSRYFGDLKIMLMLDKSGTYVNCQMYLSTALIGVQTLTASQNKYRFDLQLANYTAEGKLILTLDDSPQVSKVSGNFEYSVAINNESFTFKGDIIAWHVSE
ncbi:hypothetical protein ACWGOQ_0002655 [Aquimarina sp. M1]